MEAVAARFGPLIELHCSGCCRLSKPVFTPRLRRAQVPDTWNVINDQDTVPRSGKFLIMYKRPGQVWRSGQRLALCAFLSGAACLQIRLCSLAPPSMQIGAPASDSTSGRCTTCGCILLTFPPPLAAEGADKLGWRHDRAAQLHRGGGAEAFHQQFGAASADKLPTRPHRHHQGAVYLQAPPGRRCGARPFRDSL